MCICQDYALLGLSMLLTIITTAHSGSVSTITQTRKYFSQYDYLPITARNSITITTGELNMETAKTLSMPLYGVPDKMDFGSDYNLLKTKWKKWNLTYRILCYSRSLNRSDVNYQIAKAFDTWSEYTDLSFKRIITGLATIEIGFYVGDHGDENPFDDKPKENETYAHASPPEPHGSSFIHFDDDQDWIRNTSLFQVAVHEIGHVLGLNHSSNTQDIMGPKYHYERYFRLQPDDIAGIQALYGKKLCKYPKIDAIFTGAGGKQYVLKGKLYYKLSPLLRVDGYPNLISRLWRGLPGNIDAAYTDANEKTYFFKGTKYWRYSGFRLDEGYPKNIRDDFQSIPEYIDAAMYRRSEKTVYFFKDNKCYTYNFQNQTVVNELKASGLPNKIDAAFENKNGEAFCFKDEHFYGLSSKSFYVTNSDGIKYPQPTINYWFGC